MELPGRDARAPNSVAIPPFLKGCRKLSRFGVASVLRTDPLLIERWLQFFHSSPFARLAFPHYFAQNEESAEFAFRSALRLLASTAVFPDAA